LREIFALDEFHDERSPVSAFFEAVDRRDVRVVQRREGLRFACETCEPFVVAREEIG